MSLERKTVFLGFPLLELPVLVLEKLVALISDPYDLKALRRTCSVLRDIVNNSPQILRHLKVTPRDLKVFESVVKNEDCIKWNNFHFPAELCRVGSRRHYVETFNGLLSSFANGYSQHIQILEMDKFDFSNLHHVQLLKSCQKLTFFKADAMLLKELSEQRLTEILDDLKLVSVMENLHHLDITAFEFLVHDYQFKFMGNFLHKCKNLVSLGSWGYFPEWEQPVGGSTHLQYFLWPLLKYLRRRFQIVDLMMGNVTCLEELSTLNLHLLNDRMDWQSGKWIIDLGHGSDSDCTSLETFLYSRIQSYSHRAVGWFDESEFRKSGLPLMTNLTTVHIHNARDIKLTELNPVSNPPFPKLRNLTLIVGNRLSDDREEQSHALEKVVVDMLLSTSRPSVETIALDIDLDHHQTCGSINLASVIRNFPNLHSCCIEEWGPSDAQMLEIYDAFPKLKVLMFCGRNLSDYGILGNPRQHSDAPQRGICKLKDLQVLKVFSVRLPPKNVFPWPIKENNNITDKSFKSGFSQIGLRKFHFLIKSNKISRCSLDFLMEGKFSKTVHEFAMNWLPQGVKGVKEFQEFHETFKFLDPQSEASNFVIPDIGKWVL